MSFSYPGLRPLGPSSPRTRLLVGQARSPRRDAARTADVAYYPRGGRRFGPLRDGDVVAGSGRPAFAMTAPRTARESGRWRAGEGVTYQCNRGARI